MMKKLLLLSITAVLGVGSLNAQNALPTADEINALQQNAAMPDRDAVNQAANSPAFSGGSFIGCDSITTTYTSNNGLAGAMFDVVADSMLLINGMYTNLSVASSTFEIYYKMGTSLGFELNAAAWTLIGSANVTSAGVDMPTLMPIPINIFMNVGDTIAFYVSNSAGSTAGLKYTNGVGAGTLYTDNGALKIYEGNGMTYPFGSIFANRIWNGTLNYCTLTTGINNLTAHAASVYPNPVTEQAVFNWGDIKATSLVITSVDGKKVFEDNNIKSSVYTFQRKGLTSGIYFYKIFSGSNLVANGKLMLK